MKKKNKYKKSEYIEYLNRGLKYINVSDYTNSIYNFKKAISIDPYNWQAYINLANILIIKGDIYESKDLLS